MRRTTERQRTDEVLQSCSPARHGFQPRSCDNAHVARRTDHRRAPAATVLGTVPGTVALTVALVALAMALVGCADDSGGDAERFCGEVAVNKDSLTSPTLVYADDIEPLLDLYRKIGEFAPLAVEEEWDQLVSAYETASTVVPGDTESEQVALAAIYSSEQSAAEVDRWLRDNCAVDIGPVFTIVPQDPPPAGTVAPTSTPTP